MKSRTAIAKMLQWNKDLFFCTFSVSLDLDLLWNFFWLDDKAKTKPPSNCTCSGVVHVVADIVKL